MEKHLYLENLEEYLSEPDRVVTYKWLSRELSVSTLVAKLMLFAFYDAQADKGTGLRAYIFLGGEHSEGGLRYVIVPDAEAEAAAASFTTLSSRHIYSLQRALPKDPANVLFASDYDAVKDSLAMTASLSSIKCSSIKIRGELAVPSALSRAASTGGTTPKPPSRTSSGSSAYKRGTSVSAKDFFGGAKRAKSAGKATASKPAASAAKPTATAAATPAAPSIAAAKKAPATKEPPTAPTTPTPAASKRSNVIDSSDDSDDEEAAAPAPAKTAAPKPSAATAPAPAAPAAPKAAAISKSKETASPAKKAKTTETTATAVAATPTVPPAAEPAAPAAKPAAATKATKPVVGEKKAEKKVEKKVEKKAEKKAEPAAKKAKAQESATPAAKAEPPKPVRPEDIEVSRTRVVKTMKRKTFLDDNNYMVTEEVEEEEIVERTEAEMQAERQRIARQRNAALQPASKASKSKAGKAAGGPKQASLMSFFKK